MKIVTNTLAMVLIPFMLSASLSSLKKEVELKQKLNLVEKDSTHTMNKFFYLNGKAEAYLEILDIIEMMEAENG